MKVGAFGFVLEKYSYLRDPWNVLDFVIVLSSWLTIVGDSGSISMIRTVRLLRTLRTLRTIQAFDDLQTLVSILL
jgi:voltage-dependent calcium channel L type alpha-1D